MVRPLGGYGEKSDFGKLLIKTGVSYIKAASMLGINPRTVAKLTVNDTKLLQYIKMDHRIHEGYLAIKALEYVIDLGKTKKDLRKKQAI